MLHSEFQLFFLFFFFVRLLSGHLLWRSRIPVHKIATDCVPKRRSERCLSSIVGWRTPKPSGYSSRDSFTLSWYRIRLKQGPLNRIRIELKAYFASNLWTFRASRMTAFETLDLFLRLSSWFLSGYVTRLFSGARGLDERALNNSAPDSQIKPLLRNQAAC